MPPMLFSILQIAGSRARKALEGWCSLDYDLLACWEKTLRLPVTVKPSGSMSMRWREEKPGVEQVMELKKLQLWRFLPLWEMVFLCSSLSFFLFFFYHRKNVLVENRDRRANSLNLVNSPAEWDGGWELLLQYPEKKRGEQLVGEGPKAAGQMVLGAELLVQKK